MSRAAVLAEPVPPYSDRRRAIEAEPLPDNLGALLDAAAAEVPDRVAIDCFEDGVRLTYRELRARVVRLAGALAGRGVGKGTHVAVMLPNLPAFPVTWLALARLGAPMVPVNPGYTPRELAYVLKTADVEWLVADAACRPVIEEARDLAGGPPRSRTVLHGGAPGPGEETAWEALLEAGSDRTLRTGDVGHDDLCNIQFTSGTTGFPKGVMQTQRWWLVCGKQNAFRDGRRYQRLLAVTPFFYMDPQWQLLMALFHRGTLFLARRPSSSRYMEWVRTHRIQFGLLPEAVIKEPPSAEDRRNEVIRFNIYGFARGLHAALEERFDCVAREVFGMTETGTALFMPIEATDSVGSGSCGIAAPFREVRIADPDGRPVARGETGELLVRGPGILTGYYCNPEATAAAFHGDWFRTGDLFREDARGCFGIVGRLKDMIRRSGENIAAREVESVLLTHPAVADAAAVAVRDERRGEEVLACLVLQPGSAADAALAEAIGAHCDAELAPFKVPRFYRFLDALPRTASNKIAKPQILALAPDLRSGSYDRIERRWWS